MARSVPYADMDKMTSLSKRRGFVFQSSEIYGGLGSTWDYGPLGVELKPQRQGGVVALGSKRAGRHGRVGCRDLDAPAHLGGERPRRELQRPAGGMPRLQQPLPAGPFAGKRGHRAAGPEAAAAAPELRCPECGGELTEPRRFNLMFRTFMGPVEDTAHEVYLRPETAQGIFVNFPNVVNSSRKKLPFGIGQIGKSFRNEITPGNSPSARGNFEQMEVEFFVKPEPTSNGSIAG